MELASFTIKNNAAGVTELTVNGEDVTNRVSRIIFEAKSGPEPSVVGLEMLPGELEITGPGIIKVLPDMDQRDLVMEFLNAIDEDTLSSTVLGRATGLVGKDPVATALDVLKEWASGTPAGT